MTVILFQQPASVKRDKLFRSQFANGEKGGVIIPAMWATTMWQDVSRTQPVTAMEQTVASVQLLYGSTEYYATNSNMAKQPKISCRYNLLVATNALSTQAVTLDAGSHRLSFIGTGTVTLTGAATGSLVGAGSTRASLTFTVATAGVVTFTVVGSVTLASLLAARDFSVPYQSVVTSSDYDTNGFAPYLKPDGIDDSLSVTAIDFSSTAVMTVIAGVARIGDGSAEILMELSADLNANNGSFYLAAPFTNTANYGFAAKGDAQVRKTTGTQYPVSDKHVLSSVFDLTKSTATLQVVARINNTTALATTASSPSSLVNFGNHPLYLFGRAGTTFPCKSRLYFAMVRGADTPISTLSQLENAANFYMKAY